MVLILLLHRESQRVRPVGALGERLGHQPVDARLGEHRDEDRPLLLAQRELSVVQVDPALWHERRRRFERVERRPVEQEAALPEDPRVREDPVHLEREGFDLRHEREARHLVGDAEADEEDKFDSPTRN